MPQKIASISMILIAILSFFALIFSALRLMFVKRHVEIIEARENILRMVFALFIHLLYLFFISFQLLVRVHEFTKSGHISWWYSDILLYSISILPTCYLIYSYFNINRYFKKKFKVDNSQKNFPIEELDRVRSTIDGISSTMQILTKPKVLISKYQDFPPFVFGRTIKKSYLCLPSNWNEMFKIIRGNNGELVHYLKKFVLLHELSHIKYKDHIFVGTSFLFLKSFKYWIGSVLLLISIDALFFTSIHNNMPEDPIIWGVVYYLALFLLTRSVSRNREFIADTSASLFMKGEELEPITGDRVLIGRKKVSYLEYLLHWFSNVSNPSIPALGIASSDLKFLEPSSIKTGYIKAVARISEVVRKHIATHPSKEDRRKRLIDQKVEVEKKSNAPPLRTAIWIGVLLAIFHSISLFVDGESLEIMSVPIFEIGSVKYTMDFFLKWVIILFSALSFYVFLDSTQEKFSIREYILLVAKRYLIIFTAFSIFVVLLKLIKFRMLLQTYHGYARYTVLETFRDSFPLLLFAFTISIFLSIIQKYFVSSNLYDNKTSNSVLGFTEAIKKIIASFIFYLILYLLGLKIESIVLGFSAASIIVLCTDACFPIFKDHVLGWELISIKSKIIKSEKNLIGVLDFFWFIAAYLLPAFIVAIVFNEIVRYAFTFRLILGVNILLTFLVFIKFRNNYLPSYGNVEVYLDKIRKSLFLVRFLSTPHKRIEQKEVKRKIQSFTLADHSFMLHAKINLGSVGTCFNALSALTYCDVAETYKPSAEWLLSLENKEGGFSPVKGLKSRLKSTFEAFRVLSEFDMIKKIDVASHMDWIKSFQHKEGFFCDSISRNSKIEQTVYALNSLCLLDALNKINKKSCTDWIWQYWDSQRKESSIVFLSLKCLEILGELKEELKEEIKNEWLYPTAVFLKSQSIGRNLSAFYYFFHVAEIVADNTDEIQKLIPGVERKVNENLIYLLERG